MTPEDMTPNEIAFFAERAYDPSEIVFLDHNKTFVTLHPDGSVTYGEGITPTEAAQAFWNAVSGLLDMQPFVQKAVREARTKALEEAAKVAENMGHSNGRIRGSHKHVAAAIRALAEDKPSQT